MWELIGMWKEKYLSVFLSDSTPPWLISVLEDLVIKSSFKPVDNIKPKFELWPFTQYVVFCKLAYFYINLGHETWKPGNCRTEFVGIEDLNLQLEQWHMERCDYIWFSSLYLIQLLLKSQKSCVYGLKRLGTISSPAITRWLLMHLVLIAIGCVSTICVF